MPEYLVNKHPQPGGEHEVHTTTCSHLPEPANRLPLGWHANCRDALNKAREYYGAVDGCFYCCNDCHTR
jgi:hypothetical protein